MDLLHLAQHRFEELSPTLLRHMTSAASDALETWLRDDVCAVAAQLVSSKRFQHYATWSLTHLGPGSDRPQRRLVETVDRCLVTAAGALLEAAPRISLSSSVDPNAHADGHADLLSVIEWMRQHPWFDLACPEEFFTAERGLHLITMRDDCHAEFWASHEPRVPLGDYVCRGMFTRAGYFAKKIDAFWHRCLPGSAQQSRRLDFALVDRAFTAKVDLDQAIDSLREACHVQDEARLRDAAVALVQVYAAYAAQPNLNWLGFPSTWPNVCGEAIRKTIIRPPIGPPIAAASSRDAGSVPARGERLCHPDVIRGIASSLATITRLYRRPAESEDLIDWLRQEKRLLMVDRRPRTVYWDGEPIDYDWDANDVIWDLLWRLARRAKRGMPVSEDELVPSDQRERKVVVHRRSRLSKAIPATLDMLIEAVPPRSYRLVLAHGEIGLLQPDNDEQLVDVGLDVMPQEHLL